MTAVLHHPPARTAPARRDAGRSGGVGRQAFALALALLVVVVVLSGRAVADRHDADAPPTSVPPAVYVVEPGDTLWTIAATLAPGSDPRVVVDQLARAAGGALLQPGQRILLPPGLAG